MDSRTEINLARFQAEYTILGIILGHPEALIEVNTEDGPSEHKVFDASQKLTFTIKYELTPELEADIKNFLSLAKNDVRERLTALERLGSQYERKNGTG